MDLQENVRAFIEQPRFGVLATINENGTPQQSVVWYDLVGNDILMNTRFDRVKDKNLRRDARASLCVADGYRYVTLEGEVEINDDQPTAQADILHLAIRYDGEESGNQQSAEKFSRQQRVTITLKVSKVLAYELD
ncbi:MAG TPA: PPOX class F420-dependent oxidoreductase [Ktedonobacterales bacterium]|nr:PPOX class F420-dependent oxidoreductase [Ktedonobacterales bacterium]